MRNIFSREYSPEVELSPSVLESDLDRLFAAVSPVRTFDPVAAGEVAIPATPRRVGLAPRFVLAACALGVVAIGAVVIVPELTDGGADTASAAELIERSIAASAAGNTPTNYHVVTVARAEGSELTTDTWVGGENRYRTEVRSVMSGGTRIEGSAMLNGEMWLVQGTEGKLTVAHGPAFYQVQPGAPTISLEQVLAGWNETGCFDAEITGRESVGGREAHVVTVVPAGKCPHSRKPLKRAMLWIDVETDFAIKSTYESSADETTLTLEVVQFDTFDSLDDDVFAYAPPNEATVVEFTDAGELKAAFDAPVIVPKGSRVVIQTDWPVPVADD